MARIDRLQDRLTQQSETDVRLPQQSETDVVNFAAVERAERLNKATREDVLSMGEQINALVRMVRVLSSRVDHLEDKSGEAA